MGNGFDISFLTSALNNVSGASSVNGPVENDVKVFNNTSNPIDNKPVYTDEDFAQMWLDAGVEPTDAPTAAAATKTFAAMESAGFDLAELDEIFVAEPEVVAHTISAFNNGSASRISNSSQSYSSIIENLPENAPAGFFDAFMYAVNDRNID